MAALRGDGLIFYSYASDIATEVAVFRGGFSDHCAIRKDGTLYGINATVAPLGLRATDIACANHVCAAIKGDSTIAVWPGWYALPTSQGGVDPSSVFPLTNAPPRMRSVISVKAGEMHFLALQLPSSPIPTTARASAQIVNGFIVGLNIIDGGEGYSVPPQVTITGGGGSGATAIAQISKGIITGFTITNAGIGYTSTPTVEIEPPPFLPKLSIATSRVGVTMQVVPGKRYQLESSNDLPNFGPVGAPFVADKDTITQEFTVSETGQYFRIQEVP